MVCFASNPLDGCKIHVPEAEIFSSDRRRSRFRDLGRDGSSAALTSRFASHAEDLSSVRRHLLALLGVLCTVVLSFQVYVVRYALKHDDETRAWLPGICARSTVLRSICTDTVLLAVAFDILTDKTFPIDTPAARERVKKFQQMSGHKSAD